MKQRQKKTSHGFTLIEAMITVVILGILSAVAYPGLIEYLNRGKRTDVRTLLMENAQYMERFYTENNSYLISVSGAQPILPNTVSPPNSTGTSVQYQLEFSPAAARTVGTFSLDARPVNSMAGDACATYTVNNFGQRTITGTLGGSKTVDSCWNK
ncbi:type IV pilin protein [Undibacterium sp. Di24W]|uniref:type IV pilin protein n=1 Tax=Undibacterium sp. Di24W TaxID=3413033 RepID=UPI003BF33E88